MTVGIVADDPVVQCDGVPDRTTQSHEDAPEADSDLDIIEIIEDEGWDEFDDAMSAC